MSPRNCSILTVTHNHADIIDRFVKNTSVFQNVNIYIVDDHSSDRTAGIVSNYANRIDHIHFMQYTGPKSVARALNFGLSEIEAEIVMIVQPVVQLTRELIQQMMDTLENNSHLVGLVPGLSEKQNLFRSYTMFPNYLDGLISGFKPVEQWFSRLLLTTDSGTLDRLVDISWCNSPVLCLWMDNFEQVGYFDESFPENLYQLDWFFRLRKNSGEIAQISDIHLAFISHVQNAFDLHRTITSHVGLFKYYEKHYDRVHHQFFNLIVGAVLYLLLPFKLLIRLVKIKIL